MDIANVKLSKTKREQTAMFPFYIFFWTALLSFMLFSKVSNAQMVRYSKDGDTILGVWQTVDRKAEITISRDSNYYIGKLTKAAVNVKNDFNVNLPIGILGIYILRELIYNGNNRWDGTIYDPKSKKSYKCYLELAADDRLKVRGYKGISVFGKSQYWTRKQAKLI